MTISKIVRLIMLGVLIGYIVGLVAGYALAGHIEASGDPVAVRAAVSDSREGDMPLQFEPSSEPSDAGRLQGGAGDLAELESVAEEPARPPLLDRTGERSLYTGSVPRPPSFTAAEITAVTLRTSGDMEFAVFITPVVLCESSNHPWEEGEAGERGLSQIHGVHESLVLSMGLTVDDLWEPEANLRVAYALWLRDGETPWESSRDCWEGVE